MNKAPDENQITSPNSTESHGQFAPDETIASAASETSVDFDELLHQARSIEKDDIAKEQRCLDLMKRLKDVKEVRRLVKEMEESSSSVPKILGQFELLESLGGGGMGQVFKARHSRLGKIQAVKVLHSHKLADDAATARFYQEMRAIGQLHHPNIVSAQHADEADGVPYLVMDYVDGKSLLQLVHLQKPNEKGLPIAAACELVRQAARGIQYAHDQGVIHRDIKPGNIMLDCLGVVRVLDLGLARISNQDESVAAVPGLTTDQQVLGTPDYMAPEQLRSSRDVDARTDVYALGATLFYLLTGRVTFPLGKADTMMNKAVRILNDPAPEIRELRKDIPPKLAKLVSRCLRKDPEQRPQSADELAEQLMQWASADTLAELKLESAAASTLAEVAVDEPTKPLEPKKTPRFGLGKQPPRRKWLAIAGASLIPLLLFAGIVYRLQLPDGGQLLVECDDPNAQITISAVQGKQTEMLKLSQQRDGSLALTEGNWQISIDGLDADSFELSSNRIVMSSGGIEKLRVTRVPRVSPTQPRTDPVAATPSPRPDRLQLQTDRLQLQTDRLQLQAVSLKEAETAWQPGPGYPSVPGLLSQPAELPGIGKWNIRNRLTPAGLGAGANEYGGNPATLDPSGRVLVLADRTTVYVSEVESGKVTGVLPPTKGVSRIDAVTATHDAEQIAVLVNYGTRVQIWNQRNQVAFDWQLDKDNLIPKDLRIHPSVQTPTLRWMPDGQRLLIWGEQKAQIVQRDGTVVHTAIFPDKGGPCAYWSKRNMFPGAVSINSTGEAIAFGCGDARIRVWKPVSGEWTEFEAIPHETHTNPYVFSCLAWSPDDSRLASGFCRIDASYQSIQIWREDGTAGPDLGRRLWGLCWSPNGRHLVTGVGELLSADGATKSVRKLPAPDDSPTTEMVVWQPFWRSDDRIDFLAHSSGILYATGQMRSCSPTGRLLPVAKQRNPLRPVEAAWLSEGNSFLVQYKSGTVRRGKVSHFQSFLANGGGGSSFDLPDPHGHLTLSNRHGFSWHLSGATNIVVHDGHGKQTGTVRYENGEKPRISPVNNWNPNGSQFAVLATRGTQVYVDLIAPDGTRKQRLELNRSTRAYTEAFQWSLDGKWLAMAGDLDGGTGTLLIWRLDKSPMPVLDIVTPTSTSARRLIWSPDSVWLAAFGGTASGDKPGFLRLIHLPSLQVFEPENLYSLNEIPFWTDDTHVQTGNRLIEVSAESKNGVVRMETLPFDVDPYSPFVVKGLTPDQTVVYRPRDGSAGGSNLEIWTHKNRVASIPLNVRTRASDGSQPTREGLCLMEFYDSPSVAVLDLKQQALRFTGVTYDDGKSISLSPEGRIIDGPEDVDPYLMYIIQCPGGAEVALTRAEFHARIGLDESHQAVNWVLDIGGAVRLTDTENWLTRSEIPASEPLPNPNQIVAVDLASCQFSTAELIPRLATLPSLTEVLASGSAITSTESLSECKRLQSLDLSDTAIETISGLTEMSELRTLNLSGTRVQSGIGLTLATLSGLDELNLSQTAIEEFILADLEKLMRLRTLDLTGTKISEDAISGLRVKIPECNIISGAAAQNTAPEKPSDRSDAKRSMLTL